MKIIKHGDPEKIAQVKVFKCDHCGCEFEADKTEYTYDDSRAWMDFYYCQCPECLNITSCQHQDSSN